MRENHKEEVSDQRNAYPHSRLKAYADVYVSERNIERLAWAYCLKTSRKIKEDFDIDLLSSCGSFKDVVSMINDRLKTYEKCHINGLYDLNVSTFSDLQEVLEHSLSQTSPEQTPKIKPYATLWPEKK